MTLPQTLKVIGAVLLLFSITLPMSSCTKTNESVSEQVSSTGEIQVQKNEIKYNYITDDIDLKDPGIWITFLAFGWPLLVLGMLHWRSSGRMALITRGFELVLLVGSFIWIDFIATFLSDRKEIGAYLALTAIGIYAVGAIWSDVLLYRNWQDKRHNS